MLNAEQEIFEQIKKAQNILICFSKNWSGDSVASALAMALFLNKLGKKATVAAEKIDGAPSFNFLPQAGNISHDLGKLRKFVISLSLKNAKVSEVKYKIEDDALNFIISPKEGSFSHEDIKSSAGELKYDLVIVINSPDLESLGSIYDADPEFFYQVPIINIDRHPNNERFGQINYVELTAIASSEILFNIMDGHSRDLIDEDIATCLLAGIISGTRSFKTQNITPQALSVSSQLVAMGARREEIVKHFYRSRPLNVLKLWGRVLARLNSLNGDALVWSVLTQMDFEKTGTSPDDLGEVIDELIVNIPSAKIIAVCYETSGLDGKNSSQCLIHAIKNLNALALARKFNPTGTKDKARFSVSRPIKDLENEIIAELKTEMEKLP